MPYYSNCGTLNAGGTCYLYNDPGLLSIAAAGKYSDGTNCFTVNSSGLITASESCSPSITITVTYQNAGGCTGGGMTVEKNSVTVVSRSTTGTENFTAVAADQIVVTVSPGTGGVSCNWATAQAQDSTSVFAFADNAGGALPAQITFTVGTGNSGNITVNGVIGPQL